MHESLPSDVAEFIREHITSLEQLEILLWLRRRATCGFTAAEVSRDLRTLESSALKRLSALVNRGLLERTGDSRTSTFRYQTLAPELDATLGRVDEAYATRRYSVIDLLFSNPLDELMVFSRGTAR